MQRARRLASIALATTVGVTVLAGCRADPDVAAYIGAKRITEEQVTTLVTEVDDKIAQGAEAKAPGRSDVVRVLVLGEVCRRLSAEKGYQSQGEAPAEAVAQRFGIPADTQYTRDLAGLLTCVSGVPGQQAPTSEELADVVARGKAGGAIPAEVSVQEAGSQLDGEQLRAALAQRAALAEAVDRYDVTLNPRYRPLEFPVLSFQSDVPAVVVPIGSDPGTVVSPN